MATDVHSTRADARARPSLIDNPEFRDRVHDAISRLIEVLDLLDAPDEDMEEDDPGGGDILDAGEPWLGWAEEFRQAAMDGRLVAADHEDYHRLAGCDLEEEGDNEPSLGSPARINQACWARGGDDDREEEYDL